MNKLIFQLPFLVGIIFGINSCSAISIESGYSFKSENSAKKTQTGKCYFTHYFSEPLTKALDLTSPDSLDRGEIWVTIRYLGTYSDHTLTAGPILPIIPWPYGIFAQTFFESPEKFLKLEMNFRSKNAGYKFDPNTVSLETNNISVRPVIEPDSQLLIRPDMWTPFRLTFNLPEEPKLPMILKIKGLSKDGQDLLVGNVEIRYRETVSLFWAASINC